MRAAMSLYLKDPDVEIHHGDALAVLRELPDESVHAIACSPPFYGLRDYGTGRWEGGDEGCDHARPTTTYNQNFNERWGQGSGKRRQETKSQGQYGGICPKCGARRIDQQIGLEETPELWAARLVEVFREARRVLRGDGTLWVECGDGYAANRSYQGSQSIHQAHDYGSANAQRVPFGYKAKDLFGTPFLLAFALRADGWYWRDCIIWERPNPMPESVRDRTTKSHSYVLVFSKRPRYFWDAEAIAEPAAWERWGDQTVPKYEGTETATGWMEPRSKEELQNGRPTKNARSVWRINTEGFSESHFAVWPPKLAAKIIKCATSERGVCPECGAPWVREVKRDRRHANGDAPSPTWANDGMVRLTASGRRNDVSTHVTTLGWSPSCDHDREPVPATILDCFGGSGTTALVARKLGRHSILIELSEEYVAMAARRLQQLSLLAEAQG